jgi:threonine synthase
MLKPAMKPITYYSTNDHTERVNFETALLRGLSANYGLYMVPRAEIPLLPSGTIAAMKDMSYAEIALEVLNPYLATEVPSESLRAILEDAYSEEKIPTKVERVTGKTYIMWLTQGPTYSFKDYAARFFGRMLNHFLAQRGLKRVVVVATSGDTGGAVADALFGLDSIDNVVFFPRGSISEGQRRQMTTLGGNVYAFEVDGDFDVCQALAKDILNDRDLATQIFKDPGRFTSANSISLGRLLPQAVYPFYAYSRLSEQDQGFIASVPSGNFGDMMGTVVARQMGLPVRKVVCGVNENTEFPDFLETGQYTVRPSKKSPSSAMIVSHPSNLARLIDFYGGHMHDTRDPLTKQVVGPGIIDRMPDMGEMKHDLYSIGVTNVQHYETMKAVYDKYGVVLDPHGAVGWKALETFLRGQQDLPSVIYETADPGKFPDDVKEAIGIMPEPPPGMKKQAALKERIYNIGASPELTAQGLSLSNGQIAEAKRKMREILG